MSDFFFFFPGVAKLCSLHQQFIEMFVSYPLNPQYGWENTWIRDDAEILDLTSCLPLL